MYKRVYVEIKPLNVTAIVYFFKKNPRFGVFGKIFTAIVFELVNL